jgi:hypothetical protein
LEPILHIKQISPAEKNEENHPVFMPPDAPKKTFSPVATGLQLYYSRVFGLYLLFVLLNYLYGFYKGSAVCGFRGYGGDVEVSSV